MNKTHNGWFVHRLLIVSVTACIGLAGCAGYRVGTPLPPGIKSVYVPTFINESGEPNAETEATAATIREFHKDGILKVATADRADSILRVTLVRSELQPLRYQRDRAKAAREYRLRITAEIDFRKTGEAKAVVKRKVQGEVTFDPVGDLSSAKRDAIPEAMRDLAHDIVESVVEAW